MEDRDDPIIWRGPLKVQAIRQFVADIDWGDLDYLVIDAPPGTGDEPLTVAQNIKDAQALVVTTPQSVALADVRKSLNFCKQVEMHVVGMVENMSGFVCPHCSETVEIFKTGGGEKTAADFGVPFLGRIPIDPLVVLGGDDGSPYLSSDVDSPATQAFGNIVANVENAMVTPNVSLGNVDSGCACATAGTTCNPDTCSC